MCRKQRLQQERKAAQQATVFAKKAKKQQKAQQSDDGPPLTPEEVHRRNMRAGRFGSGAVDHSGPAHAHAPVYAVRVLPAPSLHSPLAQHLPQCRQCCFVLVDSGMYHRCRHSSSLREDVSYAGQSTCDSAGCWHKFACMPGKCQAVLLVSCASLHVEHIKTACLAGQSCCLAGANSHHVISARLLF